MSRSGYLMVRNLLGRFAGCLLAAVPMLAVAAPSAQAQAVVGTFFNQSTEVNQLGPQDCLPGDYTGVETITFTTSGRFVQTPSGYHVEGTQTIVSRMDFSNGFYSNISGRAHFSFNTNATSGETVSSFGGPEKHPFYNAAGEQVAQAMYIGRSHITYRDRNGNGQPDENEITSSVDRVNVICS
jgi:hypothetical protein